LEGDLKAPSSPHEQRAGLLLARKRHVGGSHLRRRASVGGSGTKRLLSSHGAEGTQERLWTWHGEYVLRLRRTSWRREKQRRSAGGHPAAPTRMPVPAPACHTCLCPPLAMAPCGPQCHGSSPRVLSSEVLSTGRHSNLCVSASRGCCAILALLAQDQHLATNVRRMDVADIAVHPRLRGGEFHGRLGFGLDDLFNPNLFDFEAMRVL